MKNLKSIGLSCLITAGAITGVNGESYRTDINPALLYYQAFIMAPNLTPADEAYLTTNGWPGQKLPEHFGELISQYDNQFKLVRQAARATVPCDWGIDWSAGPYTLLPHLGRDKAAVQTARLRAMWDLQNGRQAEARDDLLAAFTLGRNGSRDNSLIAVLVQIASEDIICRAVAENFGQLSPDTLQSLIDGFDAAPARGTMANAIASREAHCFSDWVEARIPELRKQHPGNDARVLDSFRDIFENSGDNGKKDANIWRGIVKASGGTSDGFLKLVREMKPMYSRLATIAALPRSEYNQQIQLFDADVQKSSNALIPYLFPVLGKARSKEFVILTELAMVRAAVEYKLHGEAGLNGVMDPYGHGPFEFHRFVFEGVDRGFELKSAYDGRGFPEVMIFVENDGPPFYVNGKNAGKAVSP